MSVRDFPSPSDSESALLVRSEARHRFYFTRYGDALAFVRGVTMAAMDRDQRLEMGMCDRGAACVTVGLAKAAGGSFDAADRELSRLIELGASAAGLEPTA